MNMQIQNNTGCMALFCHVAASVASSRGRHVAEQCHAAGVISVFACSWNKVARIDKFRGHYFAFASSWAKVAHADKFRGLFFVFAGSSTKVAQSDKLKGRQCILLFKKLNKH